MGLGGAFLRAPIDPAAPRWIWACAGGSLLVAAVLGFLLARNLGGETAAAAEVTSAERAPPVAAAN